MATIIKMQRKGTIHKPFWRIVVTDRRKPKDCIEQVGTYDNKKKPHQLVLDETKALKWLSRGAQPTLSVRQLLKTQGIWQKSLAAKASVAKA
jgi:small subunit ribosomal protein S16